MEADTPDQVEVFKTNCNTVMKDILGRFKELQFFTGESMDCDGMIAMMEYRDIDGVSTPVLMVKQDNIIIQQVSITFKFLVLQTRP